MKLFARKSIDELREVAFAEGEHTLKRELSATSLVLLGIGAVVGTGIFVLSGTAAANYAGPALIISFIFAGTACLFAGLCYAEFASMIPIAGSAYTYGYATLGEFVAWIIGWDLILEYLFGSATVAVGWSGYLVSFLRDLGIHVPPALASAPGTLVQLPDTGAWVRQTTALTGSLADKGIDISTLPHATGLFNLVAAVGVLLVTILLVVGIRETAWANNIIVAIKLFVLMLFVGAGLYWIIDHPQQAADHWTPFIPENLGSYGKFGWTGVARAAGVVFFAYIGFDAVTTSAQEVKNPQRDMPIGILGSLLVCTALYVVVSGVLTAVAEYSSLNVAEPIAVGMETVGFETLSVLVKVGAIAGLSSVMLVLLMAQPRIFYTMAHDGLLPQFFNSLHPRFRTPYKSTILTGVVCAIVAGSLPIGLLGELVSIGTLLAFVIVSGGIWFLRVKEPQRERPFRTPLVPLIPILSIATCGYLMCSLPLDTWLRLIIWMAIGLVIYFTYGRHHSILQRTGHTADVADDVPPRPTYTEPATGRDV